MDQDQYPRNPFAVWNWPRPLLIVAGVVLMLAGFAGALATVGLFGFTYTVRSAPMPAPVITTIPAGSTTGP